MATTTYNVLKFLVVSNACQLKYFDVVSLKARLPMLISKDAQDAFNLAFNALASSGIIKFNQMDDNYNIQFRITSDSADIANLYTKLVQGFDFHQKMVLILQNNEIVDMK